MKLAELQDAPKHAVSRTGPRRRLSRLLEEEAVHLALLDLHRDMQTQVAEAIDRLARGVYGRCVACGRPIPPARLQALPFALRCVPCQERHEAELRRKRPGEEFEDADRSLA
jgi:RNA polymerase-binding transcription factor DksA